MKIDDLLAPTSVLELKASDKRAAINALAQRAASALGLDAATVAKDLLAREELGSTGMGAGFAIPHARLAEVTRPFGLFARLPKAIDFEAVDGQPVDLVFLLLLPTDAQGEQLNALACVARRLRDPVTATRLRAARDHAELFRAFTADAKV
jgi:PTS system nitrogen regulatory IIA component